MTDLYHDYEINETEFASKVSLPPKILMILFFITTIGLNFLIGFFLLAELADITSLSSKLVFAGIYSPFVIIAGLIGGKYWQITGRGGAISTYMPFIKSKGELGWIARLYVRFLEEDSAVYFEGTTSDVNLRGPIGIMKVLFKISLTQLGFFISVLALIVQPLVSKLRNVIPFYNDYFDVFNLMFALGISVVILGTYYPMTILLENSNIKTFNPKSRFIGVPGATLRRRLDALVGIGAISTGWNIFQELQNGQFVLRSDNTFIMGIDYLLWLLYVMILSWPILFPAALFFYNTLERTMNEFKTTAISEGVQVGVSKIRAPTETERINIGKVSEKYLKK